MKRDACRVVVFAREPLPGRVKTRLISALGAPRATALYRALLDHTLRMATESAVGTVEIWHTPDTVPSYLRQLADRYRLPCLAQTGGDLGDRMHYALVQSLGRADCALVIGTDCPSLEPTDLRAAKETLEQGADVAVGPAEDGGYVLLGLRRPMPELFTNMPWGSDQVLRETLARCRAMGARCRLLRPHWDVDRPEDVARLASLGWAIPGWEACNQETAGNQEKVETFREGRHADAG